MTQDRDTSILVVDDNTNNLGVLYRYLDDAGFTVLVSQDGERAITLAAEQHPDLILLDIMLPGMDGFETCRRLKENPGTAAIPVIFISALTNVEDKVKGFAAGGVDYVTKPFQQEEMLARILTHLTIERQRTELDQLNRTKDKFFSIIAHDLRSPFMGLLGALKLLQDPGDDMDPEEQRELIATLYDSSERTYNLLENLLEWSRSQQGAIVIQPRRIALAELAADVAGLFQAGAAQKGVEIVLDVPGELCGYADRDMVSTVFRNLISNAVKFTRSGGRVTITARTDEDRVNIEISDTGIGLTDDELSGLFTLGHTRSRAGTQGESGSGLGLVLARDYVERNGGHIEVSSEPEVGSTFGFTLPVSPD